jgi:hypothetical protein
MTASPPARWVGRRAILVAADMARELEAMIGTTNAARTSRSPSAIG